MCAAVLGLAAWAGSAVAAGPDNLADLHREAGMDCIVCHDAATRASNDNLGEENANCGFCHGTLKNVSDEIGERHPDPHQSHLPGEPACTTCHSGHRVSVPYCGACHSFEFSPQFFRSMATRRTRHR